MPDLADGESLEIQGSARLPYVLKNTGGVYSCTCPAWRNQSAGIERRTCKHLRAYRGAEAEQTRLGAPAATGAAAAGAEGEGEGKGSAVSGPPLLLAHAWENDIDLAGWWMSEKLDGVRAYWDGRRLISRLGNEFLAPEWFVAELPDFPLDGELWLGRKAFQRTISVVRRQDRGEQWRQIRYRLFDLPADSAVFEDRQARLADWVAIRKPAYAESLPQDSCRGLDHLREELARIESLGGEGLMLRRPGSLYEVGRSTTLFKVKSFHDAEATVIEHLPGAGRHKGRLGALLVRLADGVSFSVGTGFSDRQRESPPAVGSLITFRYQELSDRGVPRFPSFVGVRLGSEPASLSELPATSGQPKKGSSKKVPSKKSPSGTGASKSTVEATAAPTSKTESKGKGPAGGSMKRYFEFRDGGSSKFWEISIEGASVTVRFGRIGANGQTQTKTFGDAAAAQQHADKLILEKTTKGYKE